MADTGANLRRDLLDLLKDRSRGHHEHAAAAHLLRMTDLARAIILLNGAGLFEESTTLTRVAVELAITVEWVGRSEERAFWLVRDAVDSTIRGDKLRKEHFGIDGVDVPVEPKRLPPLPVRASEASHEASAFYAGVYQWGSEPTHGALSALRHLEDDDRDRYGPEIAALAVQVLYRLAVLPLKVLSLRNAELSIHAVLNEWRAAGAPVFIETASQ
jgi:hypothetical protein